MENLLIQKGLFILEILQSHDLFQFQLKKYLLSTQDLQCSLLTFMEDTKRNKKQTALPYESSSRASPI